MSGRWGSIAPVTGIVAVVFMVVAFIVGGDPPDADAPIGEVVTYYVDNEDEVGISSLLLALGGAFFAFFTAVLFGRLRRAATQSYALLAGVLVGGTLVSAGILIFAGIGLTLSDVGDNLEDSAVQALHALNLDFFFPVAGGTVVFTWCMALGILRNGGLPRWLGWVMIVIAVAALTPAGFFAFLAMGIWALLASVVMLTQPEPESSAGPTSPSPGPTSP
jgi:hypothetical protein